MAGAVPTRSSSTSATTPTMRVGVGLRVPDWLSAAVTQRLRLSASPSGNSRWATVWLTMTTRSLPVRSSSVNSRPASTGIPSVAKNPGPTFRCRAYGLSSPLAGV